MNKQFEPLFTPYDAWLWAHPPVYAIANGGLGAIRAKTTVFIVSKCNRRHPFWVPPVRLSINLFLKIEQYKNNVRIHGHVPGILTP